jgi:hypothetical protein
MTPFVLAALTTLGTFAGSMNEDEHPLDVPLGELNELAVLLAMRHEHDLALIIANAVGKIEQWALSREDA